MLLNYTGKDITVSVRGFEEVAAEKTVTIPADGDAKVEMKTEPVMVNEYHRAGIRVGFGTSIPDGWMIGLKADFFVEVCEVIGLPDPKPDTIYIVPKQVYDACPDRFDIIYPIMCGDEGKTVVCRGFSAPRKHA